MGSNTGVAIALGDSEGLETTDGVNVNVFVGNMVDSIGTLVGKEDGPSVGFPVVGDGVGTYSGEIVGTSVGPIVGRLTGKYVGVVTGC